jgi:hypothetical protein
MRRTLTAALGATLLLTFTACGDDGGGGSSTQAFCDDARDFQALDAAFSNDETPDFDQARRAAEALADSAPDEIKDDAETVRDKFVEIADALDGVDLSDDTAVLQALDDANIELDDAEATRAGDNVQAFAEEECNIRFDDTETTDGGSGGGSGDATTTTADSNSGGGGQDAGDPDDPPSIDDPELSDLADQCFAGSGSACDQLFFQSDAGSDAEQYGDTCGGRFDESPGLCSSAIGD